MRTGALWRGGRAVASRVRGFRRMAGAARADHRKRPAPMKRNDASPQVRVDPAESGRARHQGLDGLPATRAEALADDAGGAVADSRRRRRVCEATPRPRRGETVTASQVAASAAALSATLRSTPRRRATQTSSPARPVLERTLAARIFTGRGDAAAAMWILPWGRVAATPRPRRGYSVETGRGDAPRGRRADRPRGPHARARARVLERRGQ